METSSWVSPNYNDRPDGLPIDMLVLHYTGMETCEAALERLCDKDAQVSAHYLIDEDGTVHRLVDEDKRAWHAGVAWWRGSTDVNSRSIGIELVNPGHEFGYRPFPEAQMLALEGLAKSILKRHSIPPRNVVGHSDVAPTRKQDPGELFDWQRLAEKGIGLWTDNPTLIKSDIDDVSAMLLAYGYETADIQASLKAFQRHFCPQSISGEADPVTVGRLAALLELS
ncbi:MAG: N-acetylmuramoyl-L-alanine amidase [Magnetovibrio sp.]|nr:N-acetylmuramoyl-L-alanine amidase [Magnetovibrio sp.]